MHFKKDYYDSLKYSGRERLIASHVFESLKWASNVLRLDLLNGHGKKALDVGCAFGYGVNLLHSLGYDAWGVDISSYGLTQSKHRTRDCDFVLCDAQAGLPFRTSFSLVTCFEVLEHLEHPLATLKHIYDSSDGVVLCTTPNRTFERIVKRVLKDFDRTHVNVKTPSEWENLIRKSLKCRLVEIQSFVDVSFNVANAALYKSFKLPFGMETRIVVKR